MDEFYICDKCNKEFTANSALIRHKRYSTSCGIREDDKLFCCDVNGCMKAYTRKDSLTRHQKTCDKFMCAKQLVKESTVYGNVEMNNNSKNLAVVNLIVFAKDGIKSLSSEDLAEILQGNRNYLEHLIEKVNFNPDKPQHHNIYYPDLKSQYGEVYEEDEWKTKKISEIIDVLLNAKAEDLVKILEKYGESLSENRRNKIKETIENVHYSKYDRVKKLASYLRPIFYNNRKMVKNTRNMMENEKKGVGSDTKYRQNIQKRNKKIDVDQHLAIKKSKKIQDLDLSSD